VIALPLSIADWAVSREVIANSHGLSTKSKVQGEHCLGRLAGLRALVLDDSQLSALSAKG